jgi:hypothetical protein
MFRPILQKLDLWKTMHVLRCVVILEVYDQLTNGANVYHVAVNCRTSVSMIETHYVRRIQSHMLTLQKEPIAMSGTLEELLNEI